MLKEKEDWHSRWQRARPGQKNLVTLHTTCTRSIPQGVHSTMSRAGPCHVTGLMSCHDVEWSKDSMIMNKNCTVLCYKRSVGLMGSAGDLRLMPRVEGWYGILLTPLGAPKVTSAR